MLGILTFVAPATALGENAQRPSAAAVEFFEKNVRPVLVGNCYTCHSADTNSKGGLRVDDRNGLLNGGNSGPAVVPGKPEESLLIRAVLHTDEEVKMPPKKKLAADQIAHLTQWIKDGAAWPVVDMAALKVKPDARYEKLRKEHWAWQPIKTTPAPTVRNESWPRGEIDRYVLATLEAKGLEPVADADAVSLIRRLTFDLTGLPPTPAEIDAFVADPSAVAFERVVDRLLASPAYGERWARHWLDVARYGESTGSSRNLPFPHAWRYRDYVVNAFTNDKPYNQFIREQVAGDLLPSHTEAERVEHLVATGFLAVGVKDVNQRFKVRFIMDNVDEQIDAVSRSFLGLTASCARCHDHKFDPIPTTDYYALAGIFRSSDLCAGLRNKMGGGGLDYYDTRMLVKLDGSQKDDPALAAKIAKAKQAAADAKSEFQKLVGSPAGDQPGPDGRPQRAIARQKLNRLENQLLTLTDPAANGGKVAMGVRDAQTVSDTEVRIRGEAEKLGPVVPRGFLSVVSYANQPKVNPKQSGRLELAEWLSSDQNPLTSRVMVNRVWQHLFGRGLVVTVDNFGVMGDVPSHPELLDFLADRFVRDGWSIKSLIRTIVLSRSYHLSSDGSTENAEVDPANRFVWRHSPRRLEAEEIRDAMLAASGTLDPSRPEASPAKALRVVELPNNGPLARKLDTEGRASRHRSLYLPLLRTIVPTALEVFDFAEQGFVTGQRDNTTVPTQALYLLNDPFVRRQSLELATRVLETAGQNDEARLELLYRLTLSRRPTSEDVDRATSYLSAYESDARLVLAQAALEPVKTEAREEAPVVVANTTGGAPKRPAPPVNPDEAPPTEEPVKEEIIQAPDARTAAWASFCQALLGSAEFRYVP